MARGNTRRHKMPKNKRTVRNSLALNTITLGTRGFVSDVTATSNLYGSQIAVDCRSNGAAIGSVSASIANCFSSYRFNRMSCTWIPKMAPGSAGGGGRVFIAYTDNPEISASYSALTDANKLIALKSWKNTKVYPVWKEWTYNVPLTHRRPWFDVNYTITDAVDVNDRSTQGFVLFVAETIGATDTVGNIMTDAVLVLRGLDANVTT